MCLYDSRLINTCRPDVDPGGDMIPTHLYHYYDTSTGPFRNLSDCSQAEAEAVLKRLQGDSLFFAGRRSEDYLRIRSCLEEKVRALFIKKGGQPDRMHPHYMILGRCDWLLDWYPNPRSLNIPLDQFDERNISFTYGDLFPAMRFNDGQAHFKQVYLKKELAALVNQFGLPQEINPEGSQGPKRYIEAQIWDDGPLGAFL